jgi:uncharacterized membrane protein YphA (DoxX/SURF4 family)
MTLVRKLARPMLSSTFVVSGADAVRSPEKHLQQVERITRPLSAKIKQLPDDPKTLVRINGAVQLSAGLLFALGRFPRLAALVMAGSLVPTTLAGHPFWEIQEKAERKKQLIQFLKNISLLGGLLIAAVDTGGKPSVAWRAQHAGQATGRAVRRAQREAKLAAKAAKLEARSRLH